MLNNVGKYQAQKYQKKIKKKMTLFFRFAKKRPGDKNPIVLESCYYCFHKTAAEASDCYRKFCIENRSKRMGGYKLPVDRNFGEVLEFEA